MKFETLHDVNYKIELDSSLINGLVLTLLNLNMNDNETIKIDSDQLYLYCAILEKIQKDLKECKDILSEEKNALIPSKQAY